MVQLENDSRSKAVQAFSPNEIITATGSITFTADQLAFRCNEEITYDFGGLSATIPSGAVTVCRGKTFNFTGTSTIEVM